jgi:hypothetical protein
MLDVPMASATKFSRLIQYYGRCCITALEIETNKVLVLDMNTNVFHLVDISSNTLSSISGKMPNYYYGFNITRLPSSRILVIYRSTTGKTVYCILQYSTGNLSLVQYNDTLDDDTYGLHIPALLPDNDTVVLFSTKEGILNKNYIISSNNIV